MRMELQRELAQEGISCKPHKSGYGRLQGRDRGCSRRFQLLARFEACKRSTMLGVVVFAKRSLQIGITMIDIFSCVCGHVLHVYFVRYLRLDSLRRVGVNHASPYAGGA